MSAGKNFLKSKWYPIMTGVLSIMTLGMSLSLLERMGGGEAVETAEATKTTAEVVARNIAYPDLVPSAAGLFLLLVLLRLVQCAAFFRESRLLFFKQLIYVLFCLFAAGYVIMGGGRLAVWPAACFFYLLAVFVGCLISLIHKRSKWNMLLFILSLVALFFGGCAVLVAGFGEPGEQGLGAMVAIVLLFFIVDVQGIALIVPLAFYSIRMDILKKIIKKTYAIEIISGILLLIVAFSFVLPAFEHGIGGFGDALWYCFAIVTTIGFGDITATSVVGRVMSVILGIYGIIVVSLITSIIVNFYGEMKKEEAGGGGADEDADGFADEDESGGYADEDVSGGYADEDVSGGFADEDVSGGYAGEETGSVKKAGRRKARRQSVEAAKVRRQSAKAGKVRRQSTEARKPRGQSPEAGNPRDKSADVGNTHNTAVIVEEIDL